MALEMRQVDHKVIVREMGAYQILLKMLASGDREAHGPIGIHNVHRGDGRKTMLLHDSQMGLCGGAPAAIGRVALHDRAANLPHQGGDQVGRWKVAAPRLATVELDGHSAAGWPSQGPV